MSDQDLVDTIEIGGGDVIPAGPIDISFLGYVSGDLNGDRGTAAADLDLTIIDVTADIVPA